MKNHSFYTIPLLRSHKTQQYSRHSVGLKSALIASLAVTLLACSQPDTPADDPHATMSHTTSSNDTHTHQNDAQHDMSNHTAHTAKTHNNMAHNDMNSHEPAEALGQDYSIYQIGGGWTDHRGSTLELDTLKGKYQVVVMAYTSCQHTCPILVRGMKQIEKEMTPEAREKTEFVLATLDTKRDTVQVMNNYAEHNHLGENWRLILSDESNTRMLANTLNIKYQFADNGDINHSNLISILDEQGRLVAQEIGVADSGIKPLIAYLNQHAS